MEHVEVQQLGLCPSLENRLNLEGDFNVIRTWVPYIYQLDTLKDENNDVCPSLYITMKKGGRRFLYRAASKPLLKAWEHCVAPALSEINLKTSYNMGGDYRSQDWQHIILN